MPILRLCADKRSMRSSSNQISPDSTSLNPAIMRKSVVLPHPDGPSRVKSSPCPTVSEISSTARTVPKLRLSRPPRMLVMPRARFSARVLNDRFQLAQRLFSRGAPELFVVGQDLD